MKKNKALVKLFRNKIDIDKAYNTLYPFVKQKKSRFVKIKIKVPESRGRNMLLKVLFLVPIPVGLLKLFMRNNN